MLAGGEDEASARQHADVLQIALAPAPVARGQIDQRRRALLERAAERGQHVDGVAGPAHQRRFDEVVAEDMAAERRTSRQIRQAAMVGEGARADDRVVAPVIAVAPAPGGEAGRDDRAGDARRELLHPGEQRVAVDDQRQALNDSRIGIGLHRRG